MHGWLARGAGVVALVLATALPAQAQGDPELRRFLEGEVARLEAGVAFTPEQKAKAMPILAKGIDDRMAVFAEMGIKAGQRPGMMQARALRNRLDAIAAGIRERMAGILNAAQMKTLDALNEQSRERMRSVLLGQ